MLDMDNNMSLIQRKQLIQALEIRVSSYEREKVIWAYQSIQKPLMKSFYVNELETDVLVPVRCSVFETLKRILKHEDSRHNFITRLNHSEGQDGNLGEIQARRNILLSEDNFLQSRVHHLGTLFVQQLLGVEIKELSHMIDTRFCKLMIMDGEQTIEFHSKSDFQQGKFAVMIVTIPMEGGFKGGRINVIQNGKTESFDFEKDSDKLSSLVGFYSDCFHEFERVTVGSMGVMIFNVIWKWRREENVFPLEFPAFLKAYSEVKDQLESWANPIQHLGKNTHKEDISALSCTIEHSPDSDKLLFFPLYEKYKSELCFTKLRGRDRQIAHLFRSISFLDVHLAEVFQLIDSKLDYHITDWEKSSDLNERTFQICRWIGSSNSLPLSNQLVLNARTQLTGEIRHIHYAASGSDTKVKYYHYVLVIQPRHQAVNHACRYELDAILDYLKSQLLREKTSTVYDPLQYVRQQKQILKQVISFCRDTPGLLSWGNPWSARNERFTCLLEMCTKMQAKEEGLQLLEILSEEIGSSSENTINEQSNLLTEDPKESLKNKVKMTGAIAEFVCKASDWKICGDVVLQIISPTLVSQKLGYYISLSDLLLKGNCMEGAFSVADRIYSIIENLNNRQTNCLTNDQISSFMHFVFNLERINKLNLLIVNPTRINSIAALFSRLELHRQCSLVFDLQNLHAIFDFKEIQSCRQLFLDIHRSLAFNDSFDSSCFAFQNIALPLFKTFIRLGDDDSTRRLIDKICFGHRVHDDEEQFVFRNASLLLDSMLLYSYEIFYLHLFFELGKAAFKILRDSGIKQLAHVAFRSEMPASNPENVPLIPASSVFLNTSVDDLVEWWVMGMRKHFGFGSSVNALGYGISLSSDVVCMIVDTLMEGLIRGLCHRVDRLNSINMHDIFPLSITSWKQRAISLVQIHNEIGVCIQAFIRNEKGKYSHPPVVINELFSPLVDAWKRYMKNIDTILVKAVSFDSNESVKVFVTKMNDVNTLLYSLFQGT